MAEERSDVEGGEENTETEQIREQIDETRSQMGETIDAIQEKLSVANITEQVTEHVNMAVETAKAAVYDATIKKAGVYMKNIGDGLTNNAVITSVKKNPLPFILIGAGAGLLAYQAYSGGSSRKRYSGGQDRRQLASAASEEGSDESRVNGASLSDGVYGKVTNLASNVYSGAGDAVTTAYDKASELGTVARDHYDEYLDSNPLVLGAAALAVGAAVGMAIPATQYEGKLLGSTRQRLMDKAESATGELIDGVRETVTKAGEMISDSVGSETTH